MNQFIKYVGLDTHKDTIAVAIADAAGGKPRYYGEIANTPTALSKLLKGVSPNGEVASYCYEAGPCGYGIYRQIERQARQRLCAFLLRHGQRYDGGKSKWTLTYWRWLERIKFSHRVQQIVFQEYIDSVKQ